MEQDSETMRRVFTEINREENINYLLQALQGGDIAMVRHERTQERQIYLPSLQIRFEYSVIEEFPLRFRQFIDALLQRVAEERSRNYHQPKVVKPVCADHGRQYFITPKLLEGKKCENKCSICLELLLPHGKRRKKVWELECGDSFCVGCIRKWFKVDSRCPNCRKECSTE